VQTIIRGIRDKAVVCRQQQRVVDLERPAEPEKDDACHSGDADRHQAIDIGAGNDRDDPGNYSRADEQGEIDDQADIAELLRLQTPVRAALRDR
jgi:hypothetical protein